MGLLRGAEGETLEVLSPVGARNIAGVVPGLLCLDGNFGERPAATQPLHA
jgi:hypothetical protein